MAKYYWLGTSGGTGLGNVNIKENWSIWGPSSVTGGQLPPNSLVLPGFNDSIWFEKYETSSGVYPQFSPVGTMQGQTAHYLSGVNYRTSCPVSLGSSAGYFTFRTAFAQLIRGVTSNSTENYINLLSGSGATSDNAMIYLTSLNIPNKFYIKGIAGTFTTFGGGVHQGQVYMHGLTLTGFSDSSRAQIPAFNISNESNQTYYFGKDTHIRDSFILMNNGMIDIEQGFVNKERMILQSSNSSSTNVLNFKTPTDSGGYTGSDTLDPTQIGRLEILQGSKFTPMLLFRDNHIVGISYMNQNAGFIQFSGPANVLNGEILVSDNMTLMVDANNANIVLGSDDGIYVKNPQAALPRIYINGSADLYVLPVAGIT
jgi:hypothetical protein